MSRLVLKILSLGDSIGADGSMVSLAQLDLQNQAQRDLQYGCFDTGHEIPVTYFPFKIGRELSWATLYITFLKISRQHGQILEENGNFWYYDLDSSYGSLVDGAKVSKILLTDGCEIVLTADPDKIGFRCRVIIKADEEHGNTTVDVDRPTTAN